MQGPMKDPPKISQVFSPTSLASRIREFSFHNLLQLNNSSNTNNNTNNNNTNKVTAELQLMGLGSKRHRMCRISWRLWQDTIDEYRNVHYYRVRVRNRLPTVGGLMVNLVLSRKL